MIGIEIIASLKRINRQSVHFVVLALGAVAIGVGFLLSFSLFYFHWSPGVLVDRNIYRVDTTWTSPQSGESGRWATSPSPIADLVGRRFEGEVTVGRFTPLRAGLEVNNEIIPAQSVYLSDPNSLEVFDWQVLAGKPVSLVSAGEVILTESEAKRIFGSADPIGEPLMVTIPQARRSQFRGVITSVVRDFSPNEIFRPGTIFVEGAPQPVDREQVPESIRGLPLEWMRPNAYTFVKFASPLNDQQMDEISAFVSDQAPAIAGWKPAFELRSARDISIGNAAYEDFRHPLPSSSMQLLGCTLFLLLLISALGMGSAAALLRIGTQTLRQSFSRIGASPQKVAVTELAFLALLSISIASTAVGMALALRNPIIAFIGVRSEGFELEPTVLIAGWLSLLSAYVLGGIFGWGMSFPVPFLKTTSLSSCAFVVILACGGTAMGFLCVSMIQGQYLRSQDTGFNLTDVYHLTLPKAGLIKASENVLRQELREVPGVVDVGFSKSLPGDQTDFSYFEFQNLGEIGSLSRRIPAIASDWGYLRTLGVTILAGEFPEKANGSPPRSDLGDIAISAEAARQIGFDDAVEAVGRHVSVFDSKNPESSFRIAAVFDDVRFAGPTERFRPIAVYNDPQLYRSVVVRIRSPNAKAVLADVHHVTRSIVRNIRYETGALLDAYQARSQPDLAVGKTVALAGAAVMFSASGIILSWIGFRTLQDRRSLLIHRLLGAADAQMALLLIQRLVVPAVLSVPIWQVGIANLSGSTLQTHWRYQFCGI